MLNTLHIPVKIGLLGLVLSAALCAEDRFVAKVEGDVAQVARRHNLVIVKSLIGSGSGVYVLQAPKGTDGNQVLRNLASEFGVKAVEREKPLKLPGLASKNTLSGLSRNAASSMWLDGTPKWYYTSIAEAAYINQQAGQIVNMQKAHTLATGEGAKVAVIDTGIDRTHIVLLGSVVDG